MHYGVVAVWQYVNYFQVPEVMERQWLHLPVPVLEPKPVPEPLPPEMLQQCNAFVCTARVNLGAYVLACVVNAVVVFFSLYVPYTYVPSRICTPNFSQICENFLSITGSIPLV